MATDDTDSGVNALPVDPNTGVPILSIGPSTKSPVITVAANDVNDLYKQFSGKSQPATASDVDVNSLYNQFGGNQQSATEPPSTPQPTVQDLAASNRQSFVQGLRDVLNTGAHGLGYATEAVANTLLPQSISQPIQQSVENMVAADQAQDAQYSATNPNAKGTDISRTLGQVAATLPLAPIKAIQYFKSAVGALPTVASTGAEIAAPLINRLAGAIGEGAAGGGVYGGATASSNDNSTLSNIGEGVISGAVAGPVLHSVGEAASNAIPTIQSLWAKVNVNKLAQNAGVEPAVAKNVIGILGDAGFTPTEAQAKLTHLGPNATLMDLGNSIKEEGGGLAQLGGKPTAILGNRMEARAATKNNEAEQVINRTLGPKPDLEAERESIVKQAQKDTKPDYQTAYRTGNLDLSAVVKNIDNQATNAVGQKKSGLLAMKGWLYKDAKDADGNPIKVLKHTVPELHEVRQAIDDELNKRQGAEGYGANAARAINEIRSGVDEQLKTVPEMRSADEKFAERMKVAQGLQTGYDAMTKRTTKEEFARTWANASPEEKETIRKGMRSAIGDAMELAQKGEFSGASQKLGQKSVNRTNLRLAFGTNADEALNALEKEASFRATENRIEQGSRTSINRAIASKYGDKAKGNTAADLAHGAMVDVLGGHGAGTAISLIKRGGSVARQNIGANKLERLTTGTADILSQSGSKIGYTLRTLNKVNQVQSKILPRVPNKYKLPVTAAAPIGEIAYSKRKQLNYTPR